MTAIAAKREFEAWFLAAAASLIGWRGFAGAALAPPPDPEAKRDAKGWLTQRRTDGNVYSETTDQAALANVFDLEQARRAADSFDKCFREVKRLLSELQGGPLPRHPMR